MKYIKTFEGENTKSWYGKDFPTTDKEEFMTRFLKVATNENVEEIKLIDYYRNKDKCCILIYTTRSEKEKNFNSWNKMYSVKINQLKTIGEEYSNEEVDEWIDNWETREDINKYNL